MSDGIGDAAARRRREAEIRLGLADVALGREFAEVIIVGGTLVNVATAEVYPADVAIRGGRIAVVGDVSGTRGPDTDVIDAEGRFLTPGLVDTHLHSYHSYIGIPEFAEAMIRQGVTAYADGFYGQGIVGGAEAVRFFKEQMERMPIRVLFAVPTVGYLQNRDIGLTPAPAFSAEDMIEMLDWPGCVGLEEPPSGPMIERREELIDLCMRTLEKRQVITGHGAGIDERRLQAYAAIGTATDHEAVSREEGLVRARAGMNLFMRIASSADNQAEVIRAHTEDGIDPHSMSFCSDEISPLKLVERGTSLTNLRRAVAAGVDPVTAIQMGTINAAQAFFVQNDLGVVAPGRWADILFVEDLGSFTVASVMVGGRIRVRDGALTEPLPKVHYPASYRESVRVADPVTADDMRIRSDLRDSPVEVRVIGVRDGDFATPELRETLELRDGVVGADLGRDILPIAMVDRLGKGTGIGTGFAQGFGLKSGALAATVNAVCENIVVVGATAEEMAFAANHLIEVGGGFVVVEGEEIRAEVRLPILGLINDEPLAVVIPKFEGLNAAAAALGSDLSSPFSSLEFTFCCGEIPDIKMSDEGLVRTTAPGEILAVVVGVA